MTVEGPGLDVRHIPAAALRNDAAAVARELDGDVVVVCNRGISATSAAGLLRGLGVAARPLEGGMRAWIATLTAHRVAIDVPGLEIVQIRRPARGCLSYLLAVRGVALVVDPAPDTDFYVELAAELGARITDVVDTHLHADHLSGARDLADRTGASLRLPAGAVERGVTYPVTALRDGDSIDLDGVSVRAIALPGHTTDMTGLVVADRALIGGDSLFADGIARPDLQQGDLEGALAMGRRLHATLHRRVLALADDVVLLPGHDHPGIRTASSRANLAEARERVLELRIDDAQAFATALREGIPPRPANYETVIAVNSGTHPFDPELETAATAARPADPE